MKFSAQRKPAPYHISREKAILAFTAAAESILFSPRSCTGVFVHPNSPNWSDSNLSAFRLLSPLFPNKISCFHSKFAYFSKKYRIRYSFFCGMNLPFCQLYSSLALDSQFCHWCLSSVRTSWDAFGSRGRESAVVLAVRFRITL